MYAKKYGGDVVPMSIEEEALFLSRCNTVRVYDGLADMLDVLSEKQIPMYVLSNSGFRAGALQIILDKHEILFVGDTYNTDIIGAHNAGLKAAWINRHNESDIYGFATYQIKDVTDILDICFGT